MKKLILFLILVLAIPVGANAAPSFVAACKGRSTNGNTFTTGQCDLTGATFLVVAVAAHDGVSLTLSDSSTNSWTCRTTYANSSAGTVRLCYVANATTTSTHTFTVTCSGCFPAVSGAAFKGLAFAPYDVESGTDYDAATAVQPGSATPTTSNTLLVAAVVWGGELTNSATINSGFSTPNGEDLVGAQSYGVRFSYLIQGPPAAINPTWTLALADDGANGLAAFKMSPVHGLLMGGGR